MPLEQSGQERLRALNDAAATALTSALEIAKELRSPKTLAAVLLQIGNASGQRALTYKSIGQVDLARDTLKICRASLLNAKNIYAEIGDDHGVANAVLNLVNQIRFFGEIEEAKLMLADVMRAATKFGDERLLEKAGQLQERLETGRIPDYPLSFS